MLRTHLYKDFASLLNDIGLMFQMILGRLTDVDLHALLRQKAQTRNIMLKLGS